MATRQFWFLNTQAVAASGFYAGTMQDGGASPATASSVFGWTVGKTAITSPYWKARIGATGPATVAAAASTIDSLSGPTTGTGNTITTAGDYFCIPSTLKGDFAAGTWQISLGVLASTITSAGAMRYILWAAKDRQGTVGLRKLTAAAMQGLTTFNGTVNAPNNTSTSWSQTAFSMVDEYLLVQMEWRETTAGTANGTNVLFQQGALSYLLTTDFTLAAATPRSRGMIIG
jgi:hypothetical protein